MKAHAAVLWEQGQPLSVEPIEIDAPGPDEVLVEMRAAGVCHSDWHPARGDWPVKTPLVLGHEGAGIVREVGTAGAAGANLQPGDHVVLCWAPACGACASCRSGHPNLCDRLDKTTYRNRLPSGASRLHGRGQDLNPFLGTACFADYAVVAKEGVVPVSRDVPFELLAMLGCAVVTGIGAVTNAARVQPDATVLVIGAGGVGLNVIQGAVLAGASRIVAVDRRSPPLELARTFGATDVMESPADLPKAIRELTNGRGVDYAFDTLAAPATLADAVAATRKGGTIVLTGLARIDGTASLAMFPFVMQEKRLIGSVYGSGRPTRDIANLASLYQKGRLKLRELVARTYALPEINDAFAALARSDGARGVIRW